MALISCPKCGKNISSTTDTCIHCGCQLTVCPECNSVFSEDIKVCTNCGYTLKRGSSASKDSQDRYEQGEESLITVVENVKKRFSKHSKLFMFLQRIWIYASALLVFGFTMLSLLIPYSPLEFILSLASDVSDAMFPSIQSKAESLGTIIPLFLILIIVIPAYFAFDVLLHVPSIINRIIIVSEVMEKGYSFEKTVQHMTTNYYQYFGNNQTDTILDVFFVRAFFKNKPLMVLMEIFLNPRTTLGEMGLISLSIGALLASIVCPILNIPLGILSTILSVTIPPVIRGFIFILIYIIFFLATFALISKIIYPKITAFISKKSGKLFKTNFDIKKDTMSKNKSSKSQSETWKTTNDTEAKLDTLSERIKIYGIIGIIIGIIQLFTFLFSAVGILNIIVGIININKSKKLHTHYVGLVKVYEPMVWPCVSLIVNLLFGGVIGVILSLYFIFFIRGYVMENKNYFNSLK